MLVREVSDTYINPTHKCHQSERSFGNVSSRLLIYSDLAGTNVDEAEEMKKGVLMLDSDLGRKDKSDISFADGRREAPFAH